MCIIHKYKLNRAVYREVTPKYWVYGVEVYEEYICSKCGKSKYIKIDYFKTNHIFYLENKINRLKQDGFEHMYNFNAK